MAKLTSSVDTALPGRTNTCGLTGAAWPGTVCTCRPWLSTFAYRVYQRRKFVIRHSRCAVVASGTTQPLISYMSTWGVFVAGSLAAQGYGYPFANASDSLASWP